MTAPPGCQTTGFGGTTFRSAPWRGTDREAAKDALAEEVVSRREQAGLPGIVASVFGPETPSGGADYQLGRRFFTRYPDWFKTTGRDGLLWIEPTPDACRRTSLDSASKHTAGTQDGGGSGSVALTNAKAMLRRRRTVSEPVVRGDLLQAFAAKRKATEDQYHAFEDTYNAGEYLLVPYATRFNSGRRVGEIRKRYRTVWSIATDQYGNGVVVTLTTDPARYDSLLEAVEDLLDDVGHLKRWLAYSPETGPDRPGYRPPTIVVPEFTDDGKPHVHVVFFGLGWLTTHAALSTYWDEQRDRGQIVWMDRIVTRAGRWRWAKPRSARAHETRGRSPREYLEDGVNLLATSADLSAKDVREAADALRDGNSGEESDALFEAAYECGERLWKVALYWATGLSVFTCSPSLTESRDGEDETRRATAPDGTPLPADAPPRWRYIGTAQYHEFPASIRDGATVLRRDRVRHAAHPPPARASQRKAK